MSLCVAFVRVFERVSLCEFVCLCVAFVRVFERVCIVCVCVFVCVCACVCLLVCVVSKFLLVFALAVKWACDCCRCLLNCLSPLHLNKKVQT